MAKAQGGKKNKQQTTKVAKGAKGAKSQPRGKNPLKSVLKAGTKGREAKSVTPGKRRNRSNSVGRGRSNSNKRGRGGKRTSIERNKKKPVTAEELDSAMDDYWMKSSNKEVASKKLDDDMDAYWKKKGESKSDETETNTKEAALEDQAGEEVEETKADEP